MLTPPDSAAASVSALAEALEVDETRRLLALSEAPWPTYARVTPSIVAAVRASDPLAKAPKLRLTGVARALYSELAAMDTPPPMTVTLVGATAASPARVPM